MKKFIIVLFSMLMIISLASCGGSNGNINVDDAVESDIQSIYDDATGNQAAAIDKTYKFECVVDEIQEDYFSTSLIRVYLPKDELKQLHIGDEVTVVGTITTVQEVDVGQSQKVVFPVVEFGKAQLYDGE